jgi:hypothetical protein
MHLPKRAAAKPARVDFDGPSVTVAFYLACLARLQVKRLPGPKFVHRRARTLYQGRTNMFGSDVLDVGVGMSLLFLMMSLIATAVREAIEGYMKSRSSDLEKGLREMFDEGKTPGFDLQTMIGKFYQHPLISSLYQGTAGVKGAALPSYIPSKAFVSAVLDIVLNPPSTTGGAPGGRKELTVEALRASAANLPPRMRSVILTALDDTQSDIDAVRKNLENWFDGTMDRVSGWYRRRTQTVLFLIGIIAATALNVDSITIATRLTSDKALRNAIVASAQKQAAPTESQTYADLSNGLTKIGFPIGYKNGFYPEPQMCDFQGDCTFRFEVFVRTVLGWFVTAFAIMLGAPFWFDVLNKFMVVRSTIKPSEKSKEEGSKDGGTPQPAPITLTLPTAAAAVQPAPGNTA